ncbi:Protein translocase membrane subunit SecG [Olavius algarvensis associated proteobacterium Delta 3]|nr:Protein translocase membrane subunit SecG [Olavius algarvensis associated proteobacterium Delta 3]CAB5119509.1 Protein translocase membrane subunit SecG [Olavius algarvensis associated proteobacterium Delta 3]
MSIPIIVIHVVVSIALILIVLLQTGKGADMGASFGGGSSQTLFGSTGGAGFMGKLTTGAAIIFMVTSLVLAYMSGRTPVDSIMTDSPPPLEQTTEQSAPAVPAAPPQTAETPAPAQPASGE